MGNTEQVNGERLTIPVTDREQKERLLETMVFLLLIVPSTVLSFFVLQQGTLGFTMTAIAVIARDLALISLIFFFLWRNGEPVSLVGWVSKKTLKDAALGILFYIPFFYLMLFINLGLSALGFKPPSTPLPSLTAGRGVFDILLGVVLVTVIAFSEETIFRGYLLLRFSRLTDCPAAVVISTVIFAAGHGYEGSLGLASVTVMGLIFALLYLWRKSLVMPAVMHFIQDFLAVVVFPLLMHHR